MQSEWKHFRLDELCDFQNGYAFKNSEYVEEGNGAFEIFRMGNIRKGGGFNPDGKKALVTREQAEKLRRFLLHESDILMCMTDMKANPALLGHTAWMPVSGRYLVNQRVGRITVYRHDLLDQRFLYYYTNSTGYIDYLRSHANSGVQVNLSTEAICESPIVCPTLTVQRHIASILTAYDELIENNARRIAVLEEMARRIYEEWFVRFRFPGHEQVRMVESKLGLIPEGWEVASLSTFVDTQYGFTETAQDNNVGPKFLRGMDINKQSYIDWASVPYCRIPDDDYLKFKLRAGDVVVIRMADPGKVGIVEQDVDAVFASYLVRLRIRNPHLSPYVLFYFLSSERYQGYITGVSTGTTRKSASAPVIVGIDLALPSDSVTTRFNDQVGLLRRQINLLLRKNTNLRAQRDLLLPKLISGEIDVSAFPEAGAVAA